MNAAARQSTLLYDAARHASLAAAPTAFPRDFQCPDIDTLQRRIDAAQRQLWASGSAGLLIIFQGLDASGKDGCIRRLVRAMDPMGVQVKGFVEPTPVERRHEFLWRAWPHLPALGEISIFNRSYYEAVMIEKVMTPALPTVQWADRYKAICDHEQHLINNKVSILKFWLHLGRDEQCERLLKRLDTPERQWKFTPADIKSWELRDRYLRAASEAIDKTHSNQSPWHIVPADNKAMSRRAILECVACELEKIAGPFPLTDQALVAGYRKKLRG